MNLAIIDFIFIALILIFALHAALKGFVREVFSTAAIVLGIVVAFYLYKNGAAFIRQKLPDLETVRVLPEILSFGCIFAVVFAFIKCIGRLLQDIVEGVRLGGINSFLGFLVGILEGLCVVAVVIFIFHIQPLFDPSPILATSIFDQLISPHIPQ
jgi:membrane protein required for colicin V production